MGTTSPFGMIPCVQLTPFEQVIGSLGILKNKVATASLMLLGRGEEDNLYNTVPKMPIFYLFKKSSQISHEKWEFYCSFTEKL